LRAVHGAEFFEGGFGVGFDGVDGDAEAHCNLFAGKALGEE
jgi:hypothetical protein